MHEPSKVHCPCCGGSRFEYLIDFGEVPVSGRFRADQGAPVPTVPLAFELCGDCGLVRQPGGGVPRDYSGIDRATTRQVPAYGMELIAKLKSLGVTPEDLVLDIGSNDGAFMEALRSADFRHLVGVEPSRLLCERGRARGFTVANDYFGPDIVAQLVAKHGCARAVVCRHTLEHVPDPFAFVAALRDCLNPAGGVALLEVPDGAAIPELLNVYEFWDEHLYCFGAENLSQLIERAGMQVLEAQVRPHLDTRNLLMWCLWGASAGAAAHTNTPRDCVALWRALAPAWQAYRHHVADLTGRAPRPMYLIGGSHSQYNFVNYAGIGAFVDHFIDDDPAKAGSFPPVSGGRPSIISTAQFEATARGGTVLKTGFGYPSWTARICEHARRHAMRVLDPREIVAHPK